MSHIPLNKQQNTIKYNKIVKQKVSNIDLHRPSIIIEKANEAIDIEITMNMHTSLWKKLKVRPSSKSDDPFNTNDKYCIYDEVHEDYLYTDEWVNIIIQFIDVCKNNLMLAKENCKGELDIQDYE